MAIQAQISWQVFSSSSNELVEQVRHTTVVNSYDDIQAKLIEKVGNPYDAKDLEKDLKIGNKLSASKNRGGYFIAELQDSAKQHDILIVVSISSH